MENTFMKAVLAAVVMAMAFSGTAMAAGLQEFTDFANPDGTYAYYFMQGLQVTVSEEWYQNTFVKAEDTHASFYHMDSYNRYLAEGIEDGGYLFTIGYSVNADFKDMEEMTYIGFDEENMVNYFALKPTDYPAYTKDEETRREYDALLAGLDTVISGITITGNLVSDAS